VGSLQYGSAGAELPFDDRVLAHLQIVITAKLRRRESFVMGWNNASKDGSGRGAIWLDPSSALYFRYAGGRSPAINRDWIAILSHSSNSTAGLMITPEPGVDAQN